MEAISGMTDIPLVLHGVSVFIGSYQKTITLGHAKICMVAWTDETCRMFQENSDLYEPCGAYDIRHWSRGRDQKPPGWRFLCSVLRPYARNDYDDGSSVTNGSGSV